LFSGIEKMDRASANAGESAVIEIKLTEKTGGHHPALV